MRKSSTFPVIYHESCSRFWAIAPPVLVLSLRLNPVSTYTSYISQKLKSFFASQISRLVIFIVGFLIVRVLSIQTNSFDNGPIICPFRLITGYPCPACGTTRSICAISLGNFSRAWELNPLGFIFIGFALTWVIKPNILKKISRFINRTFAKDNLAIPVLIIFIFYLTLWVFAIFRSKNGVI